MKPLLRFPLEKLRYGGDPIALIEQPAALHALGGDALILGFASAGFGALVVAVSTSVALPEWSFFGGLLFVLGAASMFLLPQSPFYALALCWGVSLVVSGLALRRRFPPADSV